MKKILLVFACLLCVGLVYVLTYEDDKIKCKDNICYEKPQAIDFEGLEDGFKFGTVTVKSKDNTKITILEEIDGKYKKVRFVPEVEKDAIAPNVEYEFNKQPDRIIKSSYFPTPNSYLNYIGVDSFEDIPEKCIEDSFYRCLHKDYYYYIFEWTDENLILNTRKQDLTNGDFYNVIRTDQGFTITNLEGITNIVANDVITSGGELWINGASNCSEFFDYVKTSAPECMYLNESKQLENLTSIDLKCKVNMNASEFNCDGYSINFIQDEMVDIIGVMFLHSNSRMNMTNGEISIVQTNTTVQTRGIISYDNTLTNHSQYFKDFVIRAPNGVVPVGYMNVTGDNLQFIWAQPSGWTSLQGGPVTPPSITGVGGGILLKGDSIAFPLELSGDINGDMSEATTGDGVCFYVWQIDAQISLTGGNWVCKDAFFFSGALFSNAYYIYANFTDLTIAQGGNLIDVFFSTGGARFWNTQTYTLNESKNDNPVIANVSVYGIDTNGNFPATYYNSVTNLWDIPVEYHRATWVNNVITDSDYTARMIIENSSYFPVNSSLDITETQNGKKDLIKIPERLHLKVGGGTYHLG